MTTPNQPRRPSGTPEGGRFAHTSHPEPNFCLDPADVDPDAGTGGPSVEDLEAELADPALTDERLAELANPCQPDALRWAVAADPRPLSGLLTSDDPDPSVRAVVALREDMPASLRDELLSDPEVAAAAAAIKADPIARGLSDIRRMVPTEGDQPPTDPGSRPPPAAG